MKRTVRVISWKDVLESTWPVDFRFVDEVKQANIEVIHKSPFAAQNYGDEGAGPMFSKAQTLKRVKHFLVATKGYWLQHTRNWLS